MQFQSGVWEGMTPALLSEVLAKTVAQGLDAGLAERYFRRVAGIIDAPWSLAAGEEFCYREVQGAKPFGTGLMNGYGSLVHRAVTRDARVYSNFLDLLNLLAPSAALFRPLNVARVMLADLSTISAAANERNV